MRVGWMNKASLPQIFTVPNWEAWKMTPPTRSLVFYMLLNILSIPHQHTIGPTRTRGQMCVFYSPYQLKSFCNACFQPFIYLQLLFIGIFLPSSLPCSSSPYLSEGCFDIPAVYIVHRHNNLRLTQTAQRCPPGKDPCYYHPQQHSRSGKGLSGPQLHQFHIRTPDCRTKRTNKSFILAQRSVG